MNAAVGTAANLLIARTWHHSMGAVGEKKEERGRDQMERSPVGGLGEPEVR